MINICPACPCYSECPDGCRLCFNPICSEEIGIFGKRTSQFSGIYKNAAVASDVGACSSIARDVMLQGGNAVDATIAATLCDGVTNMQSGGIGGGSFMVIHDNRNNISKFLNCRETAPNSAHRDMFEDNIDESMYGGRAVAIPGELKCFTIAHEKYGKLEWSKIIQPIIDLIQEKGGP